MAPSSVITKNSKRSLLNYVKFIQKEYINIEYGKSLLFDPAKLPIVSFGILAIELILNIFVVQNVRYTEIDWIAYMQQCDGFVNGTTDYSRLRGRLSPNLFHITSIYVFIYLIVMEFNENCLLKLRTKKKFQLVIFTGDTGPLVYPAGHVYIYTLFYYLTNHGQNIRLAQYCFIGIYLMQVYLVLKIYSKSRKVPPYVLILSAFTAYRIHSIYVLRLFNDPIAILFLYAAINFYLNGRWTVGSICLSLGVSVKMNILLFAPAILLLYIVNLGYQDTIKQLIICGGLQLILGAPFLLTYPIEYLKGSFNFGRVFEHKWTVNYRFLPSELFVHKYFHIFLLIIHVTLLLFFIIPSYKYYQSYCRLRTLQAQLQPQIDAKNREIETTTANNKKSTKKKKIKDSSDTGTDKQTEEEMTIHQKIFLKTFEEMLRKTSGTTAPVSSSNGTNDTNKTQSYNIHFDRAVQLAILPIFLCNFIGVMCARSLHYQFYVWYFHSLPYLVWCTEYNLSWKLLLLGLIEFAWNTYPSTNLSSIILHLSHLILLWGVGKKLLRTEQDKQRFKIQ